MTLLYSAWVFYTNQMAEQQKQLHFRRFRGEESRGRCKRGFCWFHPFALNKLCNDLFLFVWCRLHSLLLAAHVLFVMVVVSSCEHQLCALKWNTGDTARFAFLRQNIHNAVEDGSVELLSFCKILNKRRSRTWRGTVVCGLFSVGS